jgi:hypothetical protein
MIKSVPLVLCLSLLRSTSVRTRSWEEVRSSLLAITHRKTDFFRVDLEKNAPWPLGLLCFNQRMRFVAFLLSCKVPVPEGSHRTGRACIKYSWLIPQLPNYDVAVERHANVVLRRRATSFVRGSSVLLPRHLQSQSISSSFFVLLNSS